MNEKRRRTKQLTRLFLLYMIPSRSGLSPTAPLLVCFTPGMVGCTQHRLRIRGPRGPSKEPDDMSYGKCQRCEALGQVESVGTLDGTTGTPVVLQLCSQCSTAVLAPEPGSSAGRLRRRSGRSRGSPRRSRTTDAAEHPGEGKAKRKSILVKPETPKVAPETPKSPIIVPQEKRSKGGLVLP